MCDVCDENKKACSPVMYRRPLNRTVDKSFNKLSDSDKKRLSELRSALEKAKSRVVMLRDDNDQKDYIIEKERELRLATEENLQKYLVDIYNNPDVNSELRHRLSHARRSYTPSHTSEILRDSPQFDSVLDDTHTLQRDSVSRCYEGAFSDHFEPAANMELENSAAYTSDVTSLSQPLTAASGGNREGSFHQTHHNTSRQSARSRGHDPHLPENHSTNQNHTIHNGYSFEDGQEPELWSSLKSVYQLLPPYTSPTANTSPLSPVGWSSSESSVYHGLPQGYEQKGLRDQEREPRSRIERNEQTRLLAGTRAAVKNFHSFNTSRLPNPQLQVSSHSTSLPSLHHIGGPDLSAVPPEHYLPLSTSRYASTSYVADPVSHTSRLLAEIATLKKQNKELREKLRDARHEVKLPNSSTKSAEDLSQVGDPVEEMHRTEKKQNMTVQMLRGAPDKDNNNSLEEDQLLGKRYVNKSVQADAVYESEFSGAEDYEDGPVSTSESAMMDSGDSTQKIQGKRKHIEQLVARQREIMKEEMQTVLDERNVARQRVLKLEKKLASLELSHFTDNRASTLLAKLRVTESERDLAVSRLKQLARDVNETKLLYNLHKALLSDDPTNHIATYQEFKQSNLDIESTKNSILSKETEEIAKLEARIALIEKEKRSQAHHIEKLEQLVMRQRQKLNSLCAGPMLMND